MLKTIYLFLGLLLLAPAFAGSPARHPVRAVQTTELAFAYTYTSSGTPGYYNVIIGLYAIDQNLNTITEVPSAINFSIEITSGPLAGDEMNWPANQMSYSINGLYFPLQPNNIPATVYPASVSGIPVLQGIILYSNL